MTVEHIKIEYLCVEIIGGNIFRYVFFCVFPSIFRSAFPFVNKFIFASASFRQNMFSFTKFPES